MSSRLAGPATDLTVVDLDFDPVKWDRFVAEDPHGTFCHLSGWREVMRDVMGHETLYRVALDADGNWEGILPLVRVRSLLFGHYLVSMPFLNYGGPLGTDRARRELASWAASEARRSGADLLELRNRHQSCAGGELRDASRKVTVLLDLPSDREELWMDRFPSKLRSQVRRPMKEGMEPEFGIDQLDAFYEVFCHNMRDLGTPVLPRALFERVAERFADEIVFGVVYHEGDPVAAGCGFQWQGEFEITWASALREYSRMAPNMLLYWSLMEEMIRRGAGTFNFGRCTPDGGTHRFKKQWGGEDAPLPWSQWSAGGADATPNPDEGAYRHAIAIWQRVPLAVANRVGPFLARRIP